MQLARAGEKERKRRESRHDCEKRLSRAFVSSPRADGPVKARALTVRDPTIPKLISFEVAVAHEAQIQRPHSIRFRFIPSLCCHALAQPRRRPISRLPLATTRVSVPSTEPPASQPLVSDAGRHGLAPDGRCSLFSIDASPCSWSPSSPLFPATYSTSRARAYSGNSPPP